MPDLKNIYVDSSGLRALITGDPRNEYALIWGRGGESDKNPLPMLNYKKHGKYFLTIDEDGLIVASATMYPHIKGEETPFCIKLDDPHLTADYLYLSQIGVHKEHRGHGYGKSLLNSVFALAAKNGPILYVSGFEPLGQQYLAPHLPAIHARYPKTKVIYE